MSVPFQRYEKRKLKKQNVDRRLSRHGWHLLESPHDAGDLLRAKRFPAVCETIVQKGGGSGCLKKCTGGVGGLNNTMYFNNLDFHNISGKFYG